MSESHRILCVDDDANVLAGYKRRMRRLFRMDVAESGYEGLEILKREPNYAVIVSDMRMPGMNGVEFLLKAQEVSPDAVGIVLTGQSTLENAADAINRAHVFSFLLKPCKPEDLAQAIRSGIKQHQLLISEKELLQKTLTGSVKVLSDVLALGCPTAFGKTDRIRDLARQIGETLGRNDLWQLNLAVMLSLVGCITLPEETLGKIHRDEILSDEEKESFQNHSSIGSQLIANIPRLEEIAEIVAYQQKHFDGGGFPFDSKFGTDIPVYARILKLVFDFDTLRTRGMSVKIAVQELRSRRGWYDPDLLEILEMLTKPETPEDESTSPNHLFKVAELKPGMVIAEDVTTFSGRLLVAKGQVVTPTMFSRLRLLEKQRDGIKEPIAIEAPAQLPV